MKQLIWISFLLLIVSANASIFEYDMNFDAYYNGKLLNEIVVGDNVSFELNVSIGGITQTGENCRIDFDADHSSSESLRFNSTIRKYRYNRTFSSKVPLTEVYYYCGADPWNKSLYSIEEKWNISVSYEKLPMEGITNTYNITAWEFNRNHDKKNGSCSTPLNDFYDISHIYDYGYDEGNTIDVTCNFKDTKNVFRSFDIGVSAYEPKLVAADFFFDGFSSTKGVKFGNYDFNEDYVDDLVVLGDELEIYDGNDLSTIAYSNSNYDSDFEFFITDMDWDGDGDILIGDDSVVDLLSFTSGFGFSKSNVYTGSNIASFGAFEINNDFYKDVLVLNGSDANWYFNTYKGGEMGLVLNVSDDFSVNSGLSDKIDKIIIFDFDKDNVQEIIGLDTQKKYIKIFERDNYKANPSNMGVYEKLLSFVPRDIFFSDPDSDGDWELGVWGAGFNVTYYDINATNLTKMDYPNLKFGAASSSPFSHTSVDVMSDDKEDNTFFYYLNPDLIIQTWVSNITSSWYNSENMYFKGIIHYDLDKDNDSDILATHTGYGIQEFNNTIDLYRGNNFPHTKGIIPINESDNVKFNLSYTGNAHNYFFKVNLGNNVYRNDYFDSQQNLKYYQVSENNSYEFDYSNFNEYNIDFALNKYSMILTDVLSLPVTKDTCNNVYSFDDLTISINCDSHGNSSYKEFVTQNLTIQNAIIDWNNVNVSNNTTFVNATSCVIKNSVIENIELINSSCSFENTTIEFLNSSSIVNLIDSEVNKLDSTSNITTNNTNIYDLDGINITSYYGNITGDIVLANMYGVNFSLTGTYYNYSKTTINLVSENNLVDVYANSSDITFTSTYTNWFLHDINGVLENRSFEFETNHEYFQRNYSLYNFSSEENVNFVATGIPEWDYSENNSHMTDFRNYTLLQNIENLDEVKISYGALNLTINDPYNYSFVNLTDKINRTSNSFSVGIDNFTFSFKTSISSNYSTSPDINATTTYSNGVFSGTLSNAGTYNFLENNPIPKQGVFGRFYVTNLAASLNFFIIKSSIFNTELNLNNSFNFFNLLGTNKEIPSWKSNTHLMYYEGDLFNENNQIELIN